MFAVWASETSVLLHNEDVILSLYLKRQDGATAEKTDVVFTENPLHNVSAIAFEFDGKIVEAEAATVDGSITFDAIVYGDVNCDGMITPADAALILRSIVGLSTLGAQNMLNADVNGDGVITAEDAACILRYVVGLIEALPVV